MSRSEGPTPGSPANCDTTHRFTGQELDPETDLYSLWGTLLTSRTNSAAESLTPLRSRCGLGERPRQSLNRNPLPAFGRFSPARRAVDPGGYRCAVRLVQRCRRYAARAQVPDGGRTRSVQRGSALSHARLGILRKPAKAVKVAKSEQICSLSNFAVRVALHLPPDFIVPSITLPTTRPSYWASPAVKYM